MFKRRSNGAAAEPPSPPEIVCTLVVNTILDECELEIRRQRTDSVDRVFSTAMNCLRAETPSESSLASSAETLMPGIIKRY